MTFPIDEILSRLCVKDLLRFRCVSKGWCFLIDSTVFIQKHLKRSLECNAGGVIIGRQGKFYLTDLMCLDGEDDTAAVELNDPLLLGADFLGAANGLVCLSKNKMCEFLFLNPANRKVRKIPTIPAEFPHKFHPLETSLCGFGYDHVNDDFKVVKIADCFLQSHGTMVIVYSMNTNSWTRIKDIPNKIRSASSWGMFASGALHWLASPTNSSDEIILGFDLATEQFREVPFPAVDGTFVYYNCKRLFNVGGSLCIVDNYHSLMDLYLMNRYGAENSWHKAFSLRQPLSGAPKFFMNFRPISFSQTDNNLVLLEFEGASLVWYDIEKNAVKKNVKIHGVLSNFDLHLYTESLLLLTSNNHLQKLSPKPSLGKKEKNQQKKRDDFLSKGFNLRL